MMRRPPVTMYRDPMTPAEARKTATALFKQLAKTPPYLPSTADARSRRVEDIPGSLNPEFLERAHVLADVLLYTDRPEVGEALALVLAGRASPLSRRFGHREAGYRIPEGSVETEIVSVVDSARQTMIPPRRGPCLPNAKELRQLIEARHGAYGAANGILGVVKQSLRESCERWRTIEHTMQVVDGALGGFGVERAAYEIDHHRGFHGTERVADFYYVNMGDTYNATLVADNKAHRFRISTWGDEVERAERRFGELGQWRL